MVRALLLLVLLAALPAAAGERLDAVVRDLHLRGFSTPQAVVARLQAVSDRPGAGAPLAQRQRYYAAIGEYAALAQDKPAMAALQQDARRRLLAMAAEEGCTSCRLDAQLMQAQGLLGQLKANEADRVLAESRVSDASPEQRLRLQLLRGWTRRQQGQFAQGVAELVPAVALAARLGYPVDQTGALNLLAVCNGYLGDYARAEANAGEALALAEQVGSPRLLAATLLGLGYVHMQMGQPQRMLAAYQRGLAISEDEPGATVTRMILLSNLADFWLQQKDYRQALDYARRAEALALREQDSLNLAFARVNASVARAHLGDMDGGIAELRQSIALVAKRGNTADVISITQELVNLLEHAGRYREALAAMRRLDALQQELTRQRRDKTVFELQEQYAAEKRQREIEHLAAANKIKEAELAARTWQHRLWAALAAFLLVLGALLLWLARVRRANRLLSKDVAVLAEQSVHDPLTGVFNRRQGQVLLARHAAAARRAGAGAEPPLGVLLLDVDGFKQINDHLGHAGGDQVLVEIAARLRGLLRGHDAVVRWGGEEFLLLLEAPAKQLPQLAARVLQVVGGTPFMLEGRALRVTASIGCVAAPFGGVHDTGALVPLADLALYRAKAAGRNRAVCVGGLVAGLDVEGVGQDLVAARDVGKVALEEVPGPQVEVTAVAGKEGVKGVEVG